MKELGRIRRLFYRDGVSLSEISRKTGYSRNTVKRWLPVRLTDITYIITHRGWLYLAVVLDFPTSAVIVHSDQGSQYSSHDWQAFLKANNLEASMSRRGNC